MKREQLCYDHLWPSQKWVLQVIDQQQDKLTVIQSEKHRGVRALLPFIPFWCSASKVLFLSAHQFDQRRVVDSVQGIGGPGSIFKLKGSSEKDLGLSMKCYNASRGASYPKEDVVFACDRLLQPHHYVCLTQADFDLVVVYQGQHFQKERLDIICKAFSSKIVVLNS